MGYIYQTETFILPLKSLLLVATIQFIEANTLEELYEDREANVVIDIGTKVEPGALVFPNVSIGKESIIGPYVILKPGTNVGSHSIIGSGTVTEGNCNIGNYTTVHAQCHLTEGLDIGNNVFIGPHFTTVNTPRISVGEGVKFGYPNTTNDPRFPIIIKDGAVIGGDVSVAPGVIIHEFASIGMSATILRDVPKGKFIKPGTIWKDEA